MNMLKTASIYFIVRRLNLFEWKVKGAMGDQDKDIWPIFFLT